MSVLHRSTRAIIHGVGTLAIVLTASLLEWLRELPIRRALHMLRLIAKLLRKHGEPSWPGRLHELMTTLRSAHDSGDPDRLVSAMREILNCFGGVDSLNDLRLSPRAGNRIKAEDIEKVNARLGALRTQLYLSARQTIARVEWQRRKS